MAAATTGGKKPSWASKDGWNKLTADELSEIRRGAGKARWACVSERARSRQMKKIRFERGGMSRSRGPRCFCGL